MKLDRLTLILNGLSWPYPDAKKIAAQAKTPMLAQLLGQGKTRRLPANRQQLLQTLMQAKNDIPADKMTNLTNLTAGKEAFLSAALAAQADGFQVKANDVWLLVQPAHAYAAQDGLHLAGTEILDISSLEAGEMVQSLNQAFAVDGWQWFAPHPARWYVRLPNMPRVQFTPLQDALSMPLDAAMPAGDDGAFWRKCFNEVQILLFSHAVNQAREAAGLTPINTLWFSAASTGACPAVNFASDAVLTDDFMLAAYAQQAALPCDLPPFSLENLGDWLAENAAQAKHVLLDSALLDAVARYEDGWNWLNRLQDADARYFLPLWQLWKLGKIDTLHLLSPAVLPETQGFELILKARDRWAFWRGARALSELS